MDSTVSGSGTGRPAAAAASTTAGQQPVLDLEHPRRERVRGVAGEHGHPAPGPGSRRGRTPRPPGGRWRRSRARRSRARPRAPGGRTCPRPPNAGSSAGCTLMMRSAIAGDDRGRDQLEVAGQHQQIDPVTLQSRRASRRRRPGRAAPRSATPRAARPARGRARRPGCSAPAPRARGVRPQGLQQRLEVAAASRDGHGHAHRHGREKVMEGGSTGQRAARLQLAAAQIAV